MLAATVKSIGRRAAPLHRQWCCCASAAQPPHIGQRRVRTYSASPILRSDDSAHASSSKLPLPHSSGEAFYGAFPSRTHTCGELRPSHTANDEEIILTGWLQSSRQVSKQLGFFTVFDHTGSVQLKVQPPPSSPSLLESFASIPLQSAILVRGSVALRPSQDSNSTPTGSIEILPTSFTLLNPATRDLPFLPSDSLHADGVSSELRARHRYLDLRRPSLANNIRLRSRITHAIRNHLHDEGFMEIETPILLRSTPEGAREFLVPTRSNNSEPAFYALPQSPQQPKQLLIASGVTDKYFQIAKCFRDEDGRKDRQPEFTQIDLEMGFVSGGPPPTSTPSTPCSSDPRDAQGEWRIGGHQVREVIEGLVGRIWEVAARGKLPKQFPVMSYWTAMTRYGSDKPDLRYDLALHDVSAGFRSLEEQGEERELSLEILPYHHSPAGSLSKKDLENLLAPFKGRIERFRIPSSENVHELAALLLKKSALTRTYLSHVELPASEVDVEHLASTLSISLSSPDSSSGGAVDVFLSLRPNPPVGGSTALGDLRKSLATALCSKNLLNLKGDSFTWITEFPLFTLADSDKNALSSHPDRWQSSHHPFTAPLSPDIPLLTSPSSIPSIRGQHYDLVLNGQEIGGGSVRIHSRALQEKVFKDVLILDDAERARFGHLLSALDCGAPPHGGIALGFDRLMAILVGAESIRDVIAFPKGGRGVDLLFNSPAPIGGREEGAEKTDDLLRMYGLAKAKSVHE